MASREVKQLFRFVAVGGINTAVDISLFSLLTVVFHFNILIANTLSTSVALLVSYVLNSWFTFVGSRTPKTFVLFILVTLAGLWILQFAIIAALSPLIARYFTESTPSELPLIIAKIIAIGATLVWNYIWYSKVVFKTQQRSV